MENTKTGGEIANIMKEKFGDKAVTHEFVEMGHGWVTRGDLSDEKVKRDNEVVLKMAKEYLQRFK